MSNTEQNSFDRITETMSNTARWYRAICMFSVPILLLLDGKPADGGERLFGLGALAYGVWISSGRGHLWPTIFYLIPLAALALVFT